MIRRPSRTLALFAVCIAALDLSQRVPFIPPLSAAPGDRPSKPAIRPTIDEVTATLQREREESVERFADRLLRAATRARANGCRRVVRRVAEELALVEGIVRSRLDRTVTKEPDAGPDSSGRDDADECALAKRLALRIDEARRELVRELAASIEWSIENGAPGAAFELAVSTLAIDPKNAKLRRRIGQEPISDTRSRRVVWLRPYELGMARSGRFDHPRFGWVTPSEAERYARGELLDRGTWRPAADVFAQSVHGHLSTKLETENFELYANVSRDQAVAFSREIERIHAAVMREWGDFFARSDAEETRRRIFGGKRSNARRLRVHLHRDRASFRAEIESDPRLRALGNVALAAESAGFYWGGSGRAYFWLNGSGDFATVYHEITHQVFGEAAARGSRPPTWLAEGIAVYMEEVELRGSRDQGTDRFVAGRRPPAGIDRLRREEAPLLPFLRRAHDERDFHGEARAENYDQAGAAVHFFRHHAHGALRRAFVRFARRAYDGEFPNESEGLRALTRELGVENAALESAWTKFLARPAVVEL